VSQQVVDERIRRTTDFWAEAEVGDRAVTRFLWSPPGADAAESQRMIVDAYTRAFDTRSTWSQRNSTLEHLRDLFELVGEEDPRRAVLQGVLNDLNQWERENVPEPAADAVAAGEGAPLPARTRRQAGQVEVVALPAGRGDCLWVDYRNAAGHHRMLIDGGIGSAYAGGLGSYLSGIGGGGPTDVDILVVTHIDLDHIEGAIEAVKSGAVTCRDVWFNGLIQPSDERGPRQGDQFEELLPSAKRNRVVAGRHLVVLDEGALPVFTLPGGARCTLLSPSKDRLQRLLDVWAGSSNRGSPLSIEDLSNRLDEPDEDLQDRGPTRPFGTDTSVANGSSIAFLFEHGETAALFTGDAFSPVLESSIGRLLSDSGKARLRLDLFKLSHHGSQNNITPELLELLDCDRFLVCTDGWKGKHPAHETIELIRRVRPSAEILFNYSNGFLSPYCDERTRVPASAGEPLHISLGQA
jgi:beta-lactamase superfamily II metal-dependent hydrolase